MPKVKHILITKYALPKVFSIYDKPYGIKRTKHFQQGANNRIRKISPQRVVSAIAGSTSGYADGNGDLAKFYYPTGVRIDAQGNIYVADAANSRIRKISFE